MFQRPARQKWLEVKSLIEKRQREIDQQQIAQALDPAYESPFPTPVMKPARPHMSVLEKHQTKARLMGKFPKLPERFVEWALEGNRTILFFRISEIHKITPPV